MFVAAIITVLLLMQDWIDWIDNDPVGRSIASIIFFAIFGGITYFVCTPWMLGKMEKAQRGRDGNQDEWEPDS